MRNTLLCLLALPVFLCGCGSKTSTSGPPAATLSWVEIQSAPPTEGPDNRHVISVLHGARTGQWQCVVRSNVNAETQVRIGRRQILVPGTDYGWRYIHYEADDGSVLLHVYLRDVQEIFSPTSGSATHTRDDVAGDLIAKFTDSGEWTILSNQLAAGDGE